MFRNGNSSRLRVFDGPGQARRGGKTLQQDMGIVDQVVQILGAFQRPTFGRSCCNSFRAASRCFGSRLK